MTEMIRVEGSEYDGNYEDYPKDLKTPNNIEQGPDRSGLLSTKSA
jgi:hypothetical protein